MTIDARPHAYIATSLVAIYDTRTYLGGVFHVIGYVTFAIDVQILPREVFEQTADETNDPDIEKARGTSSTLFFAAFEKARGTSSTLLFLLFFVAKRARCAVQKKTRTAQGATDGPGNLQTSVPTG